MLITPRKIVQETSEERANNHADHKEQLQGHIDGGDFRREAEMFDRMGDLMYQNSADDKECRAVARGQKPRRWAFAGLVGR